MDPQHVFCPNSACLASGRLGAGNIIIHSRKERRYQCTVCGRTFAETKGTPLYRAHKSHDQVVIVSTLLAHGCPPQAIVAAFGWDERTVADLETRVGQHCQQVHQQLIERPRDLGQVQADEIRVKAQGVILWLAMAIQVSTRLWLGGVLSTRRNECLLRRLLETVRACALCRPLLFCVDGFSAYLSAIHVVFRAAVPTARRGRPRLRPWDRLSIAQVVKQHAGKHVVGITRRLVQGTSAQVSELLRRTQGGGQINTAYIERLNATFRARLTALVRRGRALARQVCTLHAGVYLVGTVYNFCTYHTSLRVELALPGHRRRWLRRTPAIAAGITDHRWTVKELLWFRVPKPPSLPKHRGRPSKAFVALRAQWAA